MKIILVGPFPPPIGGVSMHIMRLARALINKNFSVDVYADFYKEDSFTDEAADTGLQGSEGLKVNRLQLNSFFFRMLRTKEKVIIHYHSKSWHIRALFSLLSLLNKNISTVFTYHSLRENELSIADRLLTRINFLLGDFFITTNYDILNKILRWGAPERSTRVVVPFIAPQKGEAGGLGELDDDAVCFISTHAPLICANASLIRFFNEEDLYGIDMCVELCAALVKEYPKAGMVFSLPNPNNKEYMELLRERIQKYGIVNNFHFISYPHSFMPVLKRSQIFLRPTNTDGDALSIREALMLKVPVVASDVVARPEGSILFRNRDINDLKNVTLNVLKNYDKYRSAIPVAQDTVSEIEKIYHAL